MISIRTSIGFGKNPMTSQLKTLVVVETAIPSAATADTRNPINSLFIPITLGRFELLNILKTIAHAVAHRSTSYARFSVIL
jgi:hypothetical protein